MVDGVQEQALVELGRMLRHGGYQFVTVSPETHRRVNARTTERAATLRDVFGWSRPFARALLPAPMLDFLAAGGALAETAEGLRSTIRFSTLGPDLFVHSAYPTVEADAVFFGPDTYRFCGWLARSAPAARCLVDVGCGSGAGGIVAARLSGAGRVVLADVNSRALAMSRVNAVLAQRPSETIQSDVLDQVSGPFDLVIANPPYMLDEAGRTYRDGGGGHGEALAVRIVRESLARLSPGGRLLLYTGAAIVDGVDTFLRAAEPWLAEAGVTWRYEELDPDVFGDELERPAYARVDRIAAVGLTATLG